MSRSKGPVATKDMKTYPVKDYPYQIQKPHSKPEYARSHTEMVKKLVAELDKLGAQFKSLNDKRARACIAETKRAVSELSLNGGSVDMLVDPHTGVRYRVVVTSRETIS